MNKLERLLKYAEGSKVLKLLEGNKIFYRGEWLDTQAYLQAIELERRNQAALTMGSDSGTLQSSLKYLPQTWLKPEITNLTFNLQTNRAEGNVEIKELTVDPEQVFGSEEAEEKTDPALNKSLKSTNQLSLEAKAGIGIASTLAVGGIQALDLATMGDKNFSASSKAIDTGVHAATGALMASGNPYAMIAGVALEGLNWITKAGGKTVLGYDVNINNSGYGNLGHMESESGRIWDRMDRKLAKRNELVKMALAAADISEDTAYEQEARTNSVTNVLQLNQIALSGGIDTSLLGN